MSGLDHTTLSPGGVHLDFEIGRGLAALVGGDGPLRSEVLEGLARKLARGDDRMTILIAGYGVATPTLAGVEPYVYWRSGQGSTEWSAR